MAGDDCTAALYGHVCSRRSVEFISKYLESKVRVPPKLVEYIALLEQSSPATARVQCPGALGPGDGHGAGEPSDCSILDVSQMEPDHGPDRRHQPWSHACAIFSATPSAPVHSCLSLQWHQEKSHKGAIGQTVGNGCARTLLWTSQNIAQVICALREKGDASALKLTEPVHTSFNLPSLELPYGTRTASLRESTISSGECRHICAFLQQ